MTTRKYNMIQKNTYLDGYTFTAIFDYLESVVNLDTYTAKQIADMLAKYRTSENYEIKNSAMIEIELRAIRYAHKALSGYIKRVAMADEAVKLLMGELRKNY